MGVDRRLQEPQKPRAERQQHDPGSMSDTCSSPRDEAHGQGEHAEIKLCRSQNGECRVTAPQPTLARQQDEQELPQRVKAVCAMDAIEGGKSGQGGLACNGEVVKGIVGKQAKSAKDWGMAQQHGKRQARRENNTGGSQRAVLQRSCSLHRRGGAGDLSLPGKVQVQGVPLYGVP